MDKCILSLLILMLLCCALCASAAQVPLKRMKYGLGQWPEAGRGNHRAVIKVDTASDAVRVRIPWRREDSAPESKDIIVYETATGKQLTNVARIEIKQEYGDIAFGPVASQGTYEVYYLPYNPGRGNFDDAGTYFTPKDTSDPEWLKRNGLTADTIASGKWNSLPEAQVDEIQARNEFNRFDPMEIVATPDEVNNLLAKNTGKDFVLFTEDRKFPIRMVNHLPLKWIDDGPRDAFAGSAQPGEYYVFQLGVYAADKPLKNIKLTNGGLKSDSGASIAASKITCFNLEGIDWLGRPFKKTLDMPKGLVQPMWIGFQLPQTAKGTYKGTFTLEADGAVSRKVQFSVDVSGPVIKDAGDSDLWRYSRLRWLNSTIGVDDDVIPPFTPLVKNGNAISMVGRKVVFGTTGLLSSIKAGSREILSSPIKLVIGEAGKTITFKPVSQKVLKLKPGTIEETYTAQGSKLGLAITTKTEADGTITCEATFTAKKDISLDDIRLQIPIKKAVAKYLMGFGVRGGFRKADIKWKWDIDRQDNMVWIGDADAGVQFKMCPHEDFWDFNFRATGVPETWSNAGKGGCNVTESGSTVLVDAYTGPKTLEAGKKFSLRYRFLVTPLKPIDANHWNWRYGSTADGGNIYHLHHGTTENPYINYPFRTANLIKQLAKDIQGDGKVRTDYGVLTYPAKGNINQERGSMHAWVRVNFDSTIVAPLQSKYNRAFFDLLYKDNSSFSLYWNIDDHGMRAYTRENNANPFVMSSSSPEWKMGSKALITLSWGDQVQVFVDGKLKSSMPWKGSVKRPIEDGVIKFSDGFILEAIKITDTPYQEGTQVTPTADEHTLLLDTFSNWKGKVTTPEKISSGAGIITGVAKAIPNGTGKAMEFSYREAKSGHIGLNLYYTVRELSNNVAEMWALRSLGDEIFQGRETFIYSVEKTMFGQAGGGYPWLQEHLGFGYVPAWRQPLGNGETDAAIGTIGLSRWHNYYVQGMDWLMKNTGIDGLYLDGIGYDREIMKRITKTMYRANPNSRVNFHSGNNYDFMDMRTSALNSYMEHLPYMSNLWIGEMYDYNRDPDYWLVEISGIPFGLTSEMLNYENGGNAYRGMLYGMTGRQHVSAPAMWKFWDEFGIQKAKMIGYWDPKCPVKTDQPGVLATVYKKQGKSLISLAHWPSANEKRKVSGVAKIITKAPVIDGRINPEEWAGAAKLSDFKVVGQEMPAREQTEVWITSDSENLYIAYRCHTTGDPVKAVVKNRDSGLWEDDSVELFIQPDPERSVYYQFIGNSIGTFFDGKGMDKAWNGDWTYKTSVSANSWDGEVSIPLKSLGINTPLDGTKIGLNICRDHQTPSGYGSSWSKVSAGYHDTGAFGRLEFSSTKEATQQEMPLPGQIAEKLRPVETRLTIDWKALGIDPAKAKLVAPAIKGFQDHAIFSPKDDIPVEQTKGWLLVLE